MAEIIIRNAVKDDVDEIVKLEQECFAVPWSRESLEYDITSNPMSAYFVAVIDGQVAGYVGFWLILDECHINNVAVSPLFRKQHIGSRIIKTMIDSCKEAGVDRFTLEVRKSNIPAIGLYEKYDFKACGERKGYYEDNGEDAIIMWRE